MVKQTQTMSLFDHLEGLALKGLNFIKNTAKTNPLQELYTFNLMKAVLKMLLIHKLIFNIIQMVQTTRRLPRFGTICTV